MDADACYSNVKPLGKAVNQQLWTSSMVYPCRTQLRSRPCQPLVILSWVFHHHGLNLCGWRVFTHHQAGVEETPEHSGSEAPDSPHPWSLLQRPAQEPFCHSRGTGVLRPQHISSKVNQTFHHTLVFALPVWALHIVMFVAALSAGVALFTTQPFFIFWLLISPVLHSFHINLGDQR